MSDGVWFAAIAGVVVVLVVLILRFGRGRIRARGEWADRGSIDLTGEQGAPTPPVGHRVRAGWIGGKAKVRSQGNADESYGVIRGPLDTEQTDPPSPKPPAP
jgi:hypothetical protein